MKEEVLKQYVVEALPVKLLHKYFQLHFSLNISKIIEEKSWRYDYGKN